MLFLILFIIAAIVAAVAFVELYKVAMKLRDLKDKLISDAFWKENHELELSNKIVRLEMENTDMQRCIVMLSEELHKVNGRKIEVEKYFA